MTFCFRLSILILYTVFTSLIVRWPFLEIVCIGNFPAARRLHILLSLDLEIMWCIHSQHTRLACLVHKWVSEKGKAKTTFETVPFLISLHSRKDDWWFTGCGREHFHETSSTSFPSLMFFFSSGNYFCWTSRRGNQSIENNI